MLILLNMLKAMLVQNLVLTQTSKTKIACVWDLMFVSINMSQVDGLVQYLVLKIVCAWDLVLTQEVSLRLFNK